MPRSGRRNTDGSGSIRIRRTHEHAGELCIRDNATTAQLSTLCDSRVIWGGDATVLEVGAQPLPPRATEIRFADRFSMALLDAAHFSSNEVPALPTS